MEERDVQRALKPGVRDQTLLRHALFARVVHGVDALAVLILLITGLALGGVLSGATTAALGGHLAVNATHRLLGVALTAALVLLALSCPRRIGRLIRDILRFRWREWRWYAGFLLFLGRPSRHAVPFHDGRFDPAQRIVFACIIAALVALCATGVYLFWSPPLPPSLMGPMIRVHIIAAWVLIAALCLHIFAGSGLLRTHRRLIAAMFGNGRVSAALARGLWPGWARRRNGGQ